jgi:hypothetical protein
MKIVGLANLLREFGTPMVTHQESLYRKVHTLGNTYIGWEN